MCQGPPSATGAPILMITCRRFRPLFMGYQLLEVIPITFSTLRSAEPTSAVPWDRRSIKARKQESQPSMPRLSNQPSLFWTSHAIYRAIASVIALMITRLSRTTFRARVNLSRVATRLNTARWRILIRRRLPGFRVTACRVFPTAIFRCPSIIRRRDFG